jgi:tetratricopeptide (TPR) repeat protein
LQASADLPEDVLHRSLTHLQATELLDETRLFPECTYPFKPALTHEVAYGSLLQERRRVLHARIVEALEALAGGRVAEQVERLAHHALRGEVWDKALAYGRQAEEKALARSAHREAVEYFEQALSTLPHLPDQHATREQAIDLRLALRSALFPSGDSGRILACLREAESFATALDDPRRLGQVSRFLSNYFYVMGAHDQAVAAGQRALALAMAGEDSVLQALANFYLGRPYQAQGDYARAIECYRQTVASLDGTWRHERFGQAILPAVQSRAFLAECYAELGTFAEGRALGEEGLWIAEMVAHPGSLMWAHYGLGLLALCQGALGYFQARCRLSLGETHLLAGCLEEAYTLAEQALAHARERQERGNQAYALRLLGDVAAWREPPEGEPAEAHYRQALALAKELGMRPLQAHCRRGLGMLYAMIGQQEQARTELSAAIMLYRAMDMTFWLPQTEAALAQVE